MLSLRIDKKIEEQFRKTIGELRGTHRGNLKTALEEALFMWTQMYRKGYDIGVKKGYESEMRKQLQKMMKDQQDQGQKEEEEKQDSNKSKE